MLNLTSNCDAVKSQNRDTILGAVPRFVQAWRDFWIRLSYLGLYVSTVTRFSLAQRDFVCHYVLFKCFSSFLKEGEKRASREKNLRNQSM